MSNEQTTRKEEQGFFVVDIIMMILVTVNLLWIIFDWLYMSSGFRSALDSVAPQLNAFYGDRIHENFVLYDLIFVAIYLIEFTIRWIIAIVNRTYHRWFFFPFVHFYDLLGCIPIGPFRFFRLIRVVSIMYRLHRLGVIDLRQTFLFSTIIKYWNILVEEITNRVVVNMLQGVQSEIRHGHPVADRIMDQVVRPRKDRLAEWLSRRIQHVTSQNFYQNRELMRNYITGLISEAVDQNQEIKAIARIPIIGKQLSSNLERAIIDIVYSVMTQVVEDIATADHNQLVYEITDSAFDDVMSAERDRSLNNMILEMVDQSMDIIIEKAQVQQWKIREEDERATRKTGAPAAPPP